jgi:proline iminopeptidase
MIKIQTLFLLLIVSLAWISCSQKQTAADQNSYFETTDTGVLDGGVQMIPINTAKGTFNIWTKKFGNNPKMKVLLLNGGPGATHEYFECFENFFPKEGIEFIYYDQLGCGNSDNPKDTAMWDLSRYVDEVEQVRTALKLDSTNFYVLGHSWGGILAMEYALKYQKNLKGLIISNMMASVPAYGRYADKVLAKQMDPKVVAEVKALEANNDYNNPRYMELLMPNFYAQHILRMPIDKWPEPVNRSFGKMNQSLYVTMQGPSEFGVAGKLLNWDRMEDLKKINTPTLVIGAKHDTMDPFFMEKMAAQVQNGTYLFCPNGSHMSMYDDQQTYFTGLTKFVKGVNEGEKKVKL